MDSDEKPEKYYDKILSQGGKRSRKVKLLLDPIISDAFSQSATEAVAKKAEENKKVDSTDRKDEEDPVNVGNPDLQPEKDLDISVEKGPEVLVDNETNKEDSRKENEVNQNDAQEDAKTEPAKPEVSQTIQDQHQSSISNLAVGDKREFDKAGSDYLANYILDDAIYQAKLLSKDQHYDHEKLIKWAKLDSELQKFAITKCVTKRIHIPWMIKFISDCRISWETIIFMLSLLTFLFITYSCFFGYYEKGIWTAVFVIDLIFGFDVIMRLGIEIWRHKTLVPCSVHLIPYTASQALWDVMALIPIERIYLLLTSTTSGIDSLHQLNYVDYMRMNRFLRFGRIFKFFNIMKFEGKGNQNFMFILEYMIWYFAFIHFMACVFFVMLDMSPLDYLLSLKEDSTKNGWMVSILNKEGLNQRPKEQYIISLGFSTAVVTTVGYGDFYPKTFIEMGVCIVVMLIGAIVLTGNFSSVLTTFELETDGARFDIFHRAQAIKRHLIAVKCNSLLRNKILEYYELLWNYRQGVYDVVMFHYLPSSMQEDILYDISREMFHKSSFFRDLDEAFLRAVSRIVSVNLFNADMILCEAGSYAVNMYYIIQGEVNVRSRLDRERISTILRAGSIIGEINLFFSCPYETSLETRTTCQILQIRKHDLMELFKDYNDVLRIMRDKVQTRLKTMKKVYNAVGEGPIGWAEKSKDIGKKDRRVISDHPLELRWFTGLNPLVVGDIPDDTICPIIVDMKCRDSSYEKSHSICFETCKIPPILASEYEWVRNWEKLVIFITLLYSFLVPYGFAFGSSSEFDVYLHRIDKMLQYPVVVIYMIDVFVEIGSACPVTGIYFKMRDGIKILAKRFSFWIDVAAAIPFVFVDDDHHQSALAAVLIFVHTLKLWKVIRYLAYLENKYTDWIFWVRMARTVIALFYGIHFIACSLFYAACPTEGDTIKCGSRTWMTSYSNDRDDYGAKKTVQSNTLEELVTEKPYLLSVFYGCATLTSAGFGDFSPMNFYEIFWSIIFQLIGFLLIGYYTAVLTSALACIARPMLGLQQKISLVVEFVKHHGLSENLSARIKQHYQLQHQLMDGIILPKYSKHLMFDAPKNFTDDVLLQEVELFLDGVPIFTKADAKILIKIAEKMRRLMVPANSTFLRRGECRRTLYIIIKGSVAITDLQATVYKDIIEASGHFGLRDLLYGEPSDCNIRTLSDCFMWAIDFDNFKNAFAYEDETLDWVLEEREKVRARMEAMQQVYDSYDHKLEFFDDTTVHIPSWNKMPKTRLEVNDRCTYKEYNEPFMQMRILTRIFCRMFLLHKSIHPAGTFARLWCSFMSLLSCCTIIFLLVEHLMWFRTPTLRMVQIACNLINFLDIYIKFHWGYFSENNVLIFHPLKTSAKYVSRGSFFTDIVFCLPYELLTYIFKGTTFLGYGPGATWYTSLRWTRFFQILRLPIIFKIGHSTFKLRSTVLITLYVLTTAALCTAFSTYAIYLACPFPVKFWEEGDEYRMPMCLDDTLATRLKGITFDDLDSSWERWIVGMYYVTQVILVIGYGDMITLNKAELYLVIVLMVFGFLITRCIIADITAAEVDSEMLRDEFTGNMNTLLYIMEREKVHEKLIKSMKVYFWHTWFKSKCYQPTIAFADLNFGLKMDLFQEYIGERIAAVPLFAGLSTNALRALCTYFNKYYFVRGQHIVRGGNMEYDMYIITKGIVWVLDRNSQYIMNLHVGQTFGEISMMYLIPRRYNVVAGSQSEALALSPESYQAVIECYPSIKRCFEDKLKKTQFRDLFEVEMARLKLERANMTEEAMNLKGEETRLRTRFVKKLINSREPTVLLETHMVIKPLSIFQKFMAWFYGDGERNNGLPFFYFVADKNEKEYKCKFLIHPNCKFMLYFNDYITWYSIISPAIILYMICFDCEACLVLQFSTIAEKAMYLFIFLQFFSPFLTDDMEYCKNHEEIITHYFFSLTLFPMDLLSTLPYEYLDMLDNRFQFFILFRLLRLVRFYREQSYKKNIFSITTFRYKITISIASFFLMAHILACLFYFISACEAININKSVCRPKTWTGTYAQSENIEPYSPKEAWKWYVVSLYWVVTTVSTTGFGDIELSNTTEMGVAIIAIFCGAFVLSVILSHFGAGIASLSKIFREYVYQVKLLMRQSKVIGLSQKQMDNITAYFLMLWHGCRGISYDMATAVLPETLRIDVCYALYAKVIENSRIFADVGDKTFVAQVCSRVTHSMYLPGVTIETQGNLGDSMYIVFKGRVAAYARNPQGQFKVTRGYVAGNIFGILPAFFYDEEYRNSYRAETVVEALKLNQSDIYHLAANYPKFSAICQILILVKALTRAVKLEDCIFAEEKTAKKGLFEIEMKDLKNNPEANKEPLIVVAPEQEIARNPSIMSLGGPKKGTNDFAAKKGRKQSRMMKTGAIKVVKIKTFRDVTKTQPAALTIRKIGKNARKKSKAMMGVSRAVLRKTHFQGVTVPDNPEAKESTTNIKKPKPKTK